jgi:Fe-S cluster assembly ATPase SufC
MMNLRSIFLVPDALVRMRTHLQTLAVDPSSDLLNRIGNLITEGSKQVNKMDGKEAYLELGPTGSGKSTAVNYIAGRKMVRKENKETGEITIDCENPLAEIGNGAQSKTLYPTVININTDFAIVDTAGFGDNRGSEYDICAAYLLGGIFEKAKEIKGIMLFIQKADLVDSRLIKLISFFRQLNQLLNDKPAFQGSILFTVTKTDFDSKTEKQLYNLLKIRRKELMVKDPLSGNIELNDIDWLFDEMLKDNGSNLVFCNPVKENGETNEEGREILLAKMKKIIPVKNAATAFHYPISTTSRLLLNQYIQLKTNNLMDLIKELRVICIDLLRKNIENSKEINQLNAVEALLTALFTTVQPLGDSPSVDNIYQLNDIIEKYSSQDQDYPKWSNSFQQFKSTVELINGLNHFLSIENKIIAISKETFENFNNQFNTLQTALNEKRSDFLILELENIMGSISFQKEIWKIRQSIKPSLIPDFMFEKFKTSLLAVLPSSVNAENRSQLENLLNELIRSDAKEKLKKICNTYLINPFTIPESDQDIDAEGNLSFTANIPLLIISQALLSLQNRNFEFSSLWFKVYGRLILDASLSGLTAGKNVLIIASDEIEVEGDQCIDVSGSKVISSSSELVSLPTVGVTGNSGGNIYLRAPKISGTSQLSLFANGSQGGYGSNGKKGILGPKGEDGKDALGEPFKDVVGAWESHKHFNKGEQGKPGKQGGVGIDAGAGGFGGKKGQVQIKIEELSSKDLLSIKNENGINGEDGTPGAGGNGGDGGYHGYDVLAIKASTMVKTHWYKGYKLNEGDYPGGIHFFEPSPIGLPDAQYYKDSIGGDAPPSEGPSRQYADSGAIGESGKIKSRSSLEPDSKLVSFPFNDDELESTYLTLKR